MNMQIKKLITNAIVPTKGSKEAAGNDLYADTDYVIPPGTTKMIHTGIAIAVPKGYFGAIYARSGLAVKQGLRPANAVGVIDSDYRGEVIVALHNDSKEDQHISPGTRIAQLIIQPYQDIEFTVVNELDDTDRGDGGFGSTGS